MVLKVVDLHVDIPARMRDKALLRALVLEIEDNRAWTTVLAMTLCLRRQRSGLLKQMLGTLDAGLK
jgi:hypothetical protein